MTRVGLLLAVFAVGCASGQGAPIRYGGAVEGSSGAPPAQPSAPNAPAPQPDWAAGEGAPLSTYALRREQAQPYDPARLPRTHRLGRDETLFDVASRYQVPFNALADQNHFSPPYAVAPGTEIELPPPRFHVASRGETLEDIAAAFDIDTRSLALLNRMRAPYLVHENDRIVLPATARAWSAPAAAPQAATPTPSPGDAPARVSARFRPPLPGRIVTQFGAQADGRRLDGVEIAGREGDAIAAAAAGEVVYAGTDLPAYGVLVLVRHPDEYVTAYAYGRRALVRPGQTVRAGEALAELGPRSDGRPRVLFQIRRGRDALDPAPLLGM